MEYQAPNTSRPMLIPTPPRTPQLLRSTNLIRIASTRSPQQKPQQTPKAHAQTHAHAHDAQNYAAATTTTTTNTNTHAVIVADSLALPHPCRRFDFAISIAVIHHLSTRDRRVRTIAEILWLLRVGRLGANEESNDGSNDGSDDGSKGSGSGEVAGVALLYVWALEQKGSRRGWEEGQEQDVMVPWVMKGKRVAIEEGVEGVEGEENGKKKQKEKRGETVDETYHRYYHLYRKGELEEDIVSAGGRVVRSGYERDNWWAVARPGSDKEFM